MITEYTDIKKIHKTTGLLAKLLQISSYDFQYKNIVGIIEDEKYILRMLPDTNEICWFEMKSTIIFYGMPGGKEDYVAILNKADKIFVLETAKDLKDFIDMDV